MRVQREKPKKDIEIGSIPTILVEELLDASGSMGSWYEHPTKYETASQGINQKIEALKKDQNADYIFAATEFDTINGAMRYTEVLKPTKMANVAIFNGKGPHGGTPLYEAIAYTINKILAAKKPEDRVLLSIYTDGGENESSNGWSKREGGAKKLNELMEKVKKDNNFTITFVGTNYDVDSMVINTGISRGNTFSYDGTAEGMKMSMFANVGSTMNFAEQVKERGIKSTDTFYSKSVEKTEKK